MKIVRLNDNWNKVKTKEELLELLKKYKGILTESTLNYLSSLIELEFSVIRDYISDYDRKALAELDVYKKIAIYNIYNKSQNLFNQQNGEFIISGNNDGLERLSVSIELNNKNVRLFDFDYKEIPSNGWNQSKVPIGFKVMNIGNISLFRTFENKEFREAELNRVINILDRLYDEHNPHLSLPGIIGGPGSLWAQDHARKIQEYEELFRQLDSKKELSDEDKKEIEMTRRIHGLLLEDFGLSEESFVDENAQSFADLGNEKTKLNKVLVKRMPNLTITDHTKYI